MIEKIANPLNLQLEGIESLIAYLQEEFNSHSAEVTEGFDLGESGVSIEIEMESGKYSYSLEHLKKLKAELHNPVLQSLKEVS